MGRQPETLNAKEEEPGAKRQRPSNEVASRIEAEKKKEAVAPNAKLLELMKSRAVNKQ